MKIKFITWNIDTNSSRIEEGYARESHPEWRINARIEAIKAKIIAIKPDILHLQEIRNFINKYNEKVDAETPLVTFLEEQGYETLVRLYNSNQDNAFKYITAWKTELFELLNHKELYFTQTPNMPTLRPDLAGKSLDEIKKIENTIREHNYGEFWERCTLLTHLTELGTENKICTFNVHLGISQNYRLKASELLVNFVKEILQNNSDLKIIVSGDFNSFYGFKGPEQINIIKNAQLNNKPLLIEASDHLFLPDGQEMINKSTFFAFPYDFIFPTEALKEKAVKLDVMIKNLSKEPDKCKEEIGKLFAEYGKVNGGQLDHIFIHNFTYDKVVLDVALQFFPGPASYTEEDIKDYIFAHYDEGPAFASDHQPLVVTLGEDVSLI